MAVSMGVVRPLSKSASQQLLKDFEKSQLSSYSDEQRAATLYACKKIMEQKRANK